jgi:uncharacterized protein (DUF58 family)
MAFGGRHKFDQARRLCAALAYVGLANLDRVTVVAASGESPPIMPATRGKGRIFKVFRYLQALEPSGTTDLATSLKTFAAQHKRRGLALLISDLYDPAGFEGGINVLRYNKFEPYVLHIVDEAESNPDLLGDVSVIDCETGERREVTVTDQVLRRVQDAYRDYNRGIERFCSAHQVPYFRAGSRVPFDEVVLGVLRRGGLLR